MFPPPGPGARSNERFETKMLLAPRASRARAVSSLVSPAPRIMTRHSFRRPKIFSARSTATDPTETGPRVMFVFVRTSLATRKARWKSLFRPREVEELSAAAR